ncbi:unnamed protein product [Vitrella brassicaformis CCMP3155]|uniref:Uncharacterized protein n=2 Tax=Vitrella brassicaformis TaxID=1169539 RepID=A0A0G4H5P3_VITBC|nr:unnamed protein product [Vitrella brassicaformis CCMP3155]|eukprot:CEM39152.1 unnamed protein product [Vitrella brassicaformis CCMP3155]
MAGLSHSDEKMTLIWAPPEDVEAIKRVCRPTFVYCHVLKDVIPQKRVLDVYDFWNEHRSALEYLDENCEFEAAAGEKYQIRHSASGTAGLVVFADMSLEHLETPFGFPKDKLKTSSDGKVLLPVVVKVGIGESGVETLAKEKTAYSKLWWLG